MTIIRKSLLVILFIMVGLWVALHAGLSIYDNKTRNELIKMTTSELPVGSSMAAMDLFMQRHTVRYGFDDEYYFQYKGFIKQRKIDELLFRQAAIYLKFNKETKKYEDCKVYISYTFL